MRCRYRITGIFAVVAVSGWLTLVSGQQPAESQAPAAVQKAVEGKSGSGQAADGKTDEKKKELYGNMPEDLEPFRDFVAEPYHKYFVPSDAAVAFWGPGRDKPEPEVETVKLGLLAPIERSHEVYMGRPIRNAMQIATSPFDPTGNNPRLVAFRKHYQERFGEPPNAYAAHSYDGTQMVIEAIRRAGLNRYRIRDVLSEMRHWDGVTGEIIMDDVYTNRRPVCVATVKHGEFVYGLTKVDRLF